jgi:hypothetical protein
MTEPTHEQKLIHYLTNVIKQAAKSQGRTGDIVPPDWVPCRIRIHEETAAHFRMERETACVTNVWGAIFVERGELSRIGFYVHECEILELRANAKKQSEESAA